MIKVRQDLIGRQFGRLTVIKQVKDRVYPSGQRTSQWLCSCSCSPNMKIIINGNNLVCGRTKSCGCLRSEKSSKHIKNINAKGLNIVDK